MVPGNGSKMPSVDDLEFTMDQRGCARCYGDGHPGITFKKLTYPVDLVEPPFTHWAPCPTNGEPILLQFYEDDSKVPPGEH